MTTITALAHFSLCPPHPPLCVSPLPILLSSHWIMMTVTIHPIDPDLSPVMQNLCTLLVVVPTSSKQAICLQQSALMTLTLMLLPLPLSLIWTWWSVRLPYQRLALKKQSWKAGSPQTLVLSQHPSHLTNMCSSWQLMVPITMMCPHQS